MKNSEKFIESFKQIEQLFNRNNGIEVEWSFTRKVRELSKSNKLIDRYKDDLISFAYLRNAISHHPKNDNLVIAEPRDDTVAMICKIKEEIANPKKVIPTFQFEVFTVNQNSNVLDLIKTMNQQSFSQVPYISDSGVQEIITVNTITRWLSEQIDDDGNIMTDDTAVSSLLKHIEHQNNYKTVSRNTSVIDAYAHFENHVREFNRHLDAIMITENGKPNESLIGLITIDDLSIEINKI